MNPRQKRIAVEQALANYISGPILARALLLWDEKYAQQPTFALQHYLRELCAQGELVHLRSRLLQALVQSFSSLQDNLQANQLRTSTARRKQLQAQAQLRSSPEMAAFMDLVDNLISNAGDELSTRVRFYTLENLPALRIASNERWALHAWLSQINPLIEAALPLAAMQQVINLVYVALCEYLGPVRTDQLLQDAVSNTQRLHPDYNVSALL